MTRPPPHLSPPAHPRILIVDDDPGQRSLLDSFLRGQGFDTLLATHGESALDLLQREPVHLMISDVRMPGISGLETLRRARQEHATLPVLLVTAFADVRDAVGAMRDGAVDYLVKPIDLDELLALARTALGLDVSPPLLVADSKQIPPHFVAASPATRAVFRDAALVADSDSRILITGESGVGKEVVADLIHQWSRRSAGPLVKINCAAIPETLLESELFGHEKGAFTGAFAPRVGRFEEAHDGTILLDEIAELSPALQAKLLRITQDGTFQRIGNNRDRLTNARILAATNRDLELEVQQGRFRQDLFFRLNVMEIRVPPLHERREDIIPLASLFIAEFTQGKARLSPAVVSLLERYRWPGNVRELRNAMERATLLARGELILPDHLPARILQSVPDAVPDPAAESARLEDIERHAILQALRANHFNRTETARALGISRRALLYKLQHLKGLGFEIDAP